MGLRRAAVWTAAVLRASWATLWIFALPKEPWGVLCIWPTLFLAGASYLWEPSHAGERLILLATLWDVVWGFWLTTSAMKVSRDALAATVFRLQDCSYARIGWERILRRNDTATIDRSSLISFMGRQGLPYDHAETVRFFRVDIGESGAIPGGLGVYNIPFAETVILVRDDPDDAGVADRFYLYHELGHTLGDEFAVQSALRKGVKLPLAAILLGAMAMQVTRTSLLVLAMCLLGLWLVRSVLARRRASLRVASEMKADQFAMGFMDEEEKRYVLEHITSVLPQDRELSPLEHLTRVSAARSLIEPGVSLAQTHPAASQGAFVLEMQPPALNLAAWMVLLASFIGAPAAQLVHGFQWLIGATAVVAVLRYAKHYWKGILLEFVFVGRLVWRDGRFRFEGPRVAASSA